MEQGSTGTAARLEGATKDEVVAMFKKQERVLTRYKTRFSEVVTVLLCSLLCFVVICCDLCPYIYMYACATTCTGMYSRKFHHFHNLHTFHVQGRVVQSPIKLTQG